jgi:hypothetical protein
MPDLPRFRVRIIGRDRVPPLTHVRRTMRGGRYDGHPNVEFEAITVHDVDFSGFRFESFGAEGTRFTGCDFTQTSIVGFLGVRRQSVFSQCTFAQTRLRDAQPGQARFVDCEFDRIDITGWSAVASEFVGCRFSGPVRRCKFWGKPFGAWLETPLSPPRDKNEFVDNDFTDAVLEDVGFVGGIDLARQRLPTGPEYVRIDRPLERILRARPIVEHWQPEEDREEGLILLAVYSEDGFEEQAELFVNRLETGAPRHVAERVWSLLESIAL